MAVVVVALRTNRSPLVYQSQSRGGSCPLSLSLLLTATPPWSACHQPTNYLATHQVIKNNSKDIRDIINREDILNKNTTAQWGYHQQLHHTTVSISSTTTPHHSQDIINHTWHDRKLNRSKSRTLTFLF